MKINRRSLPLLIIAVLTLLAGVWGGLLRLGWALPLTRAELIIFHGPLMVCGFLGTVICLERAVAVNKLWAYLAPALTGIGTAGLFLGLPLPAGQCLILAGSLILFAIFIYLLKLELSLHTAVMLAGVLCWISGNSLWLASRPLHEVALWWIAFLLFTISGERLELSRLANLSVKSRNLFILAGLITVGGLLTSLVNQDTGLRVFGAGLLFYTGWLLKFDIARRTVKTSGITRFIAACLLSGYFWLAVSGLTAVYAGQNIIGSSLYDAFLHSFFLGFTFSMIFGHAPVIFPAVLKVQMNYYPRFYIHLLFLHLSLVLRITGGLTGSQPLMKTAAMLNALVLLLFFINTATSVKIGDTSGSGLKPGKSLKGKLL